MSFNKHIVPNEFSSVDSYNIEADCDWMVSEGLETTQRGEEDMMECNNGSAAVKSSSSKLKQILPIISSLGAQNMRNEVDLDLTSYIFEVLREKISNGSVNLFRAMINPDSFSQSAENLAAISELVKENKIGVFEGEDGNPYIYIAGSGFQAV